MKKISALLFICFFIQAQIFSTCYPYNISSGEYSTLSAPTSFHPDDVLGPDEFSRQLNDLRGTDGFSASLISNKHFVLVALSMADFLLKKPGNKKLLHKWIRHEFSGTYLEWAEIFDLTNIKVTNNFVKIYFVLNNKRYAADVSFLRKKEKLAETFKIEINEVDETDYESDRHKIVSIEDEVVEISFSVLSSEEDRIVDEVKEAISAGVDSIHLDCIDGKFTPGIQPFNPSGQIKLISGMDVALDTHLMVTAPSEQLISDLVDAGLKRERDRIYVHFESFHDKADLIKLLGFIKKKGLKAGLVLNPETQISNIEEYFPEMADLMDTIMIMVIIPGAGSRPFIEVSAKKLGELKTFLDRLNLSNRIKVVTDGGLNGYSLRSIVDSDVDTVVARTWLLEKNRGLAKGVKIIKGLSRHRIDSIRLKDMLELWGLSDYQYVVDAIVKFSSGDDTFTQDEIISAIKRFQGVNEVKINEDRVIDIFYSDKLVRFHKKEVMPIEHLGLQDRVYYDGIAVKIYTGNVTNKTNGDYVLGISSSWHDSTAVLIKNGEIIAALEEERMSRVKHDPSLFPFNAIAKLLESEDITWGDIKHIALGWNFNLYIDTPHSTNPNDVFFHEMDRQYAKDNGIPLSEVVRRNSRERNNDRFGVNKVYAFLNEMSSYYETQYEPRVSFVSHTQAHASSAYYLSGFDGKVLTVALDGYGDFESGSIWVGENGRMKEVSRFTLPHSLGWMYIAITEYLGFRPSSDEGQVMGFAPYGEPWDSVEMKRVQELRKIFMDYIRFDPETQTLVSNPEYYYYGEMVDGKNRITKTFYEKLATLGIYPYKGSGQHIDPFNDDDRPYANLAYVLQERTEQVIADIVRHYLQDNPQTKGIYKLALAGGVTLNILANGRLIKEGLVYGENIFVQPAAGDSGTAIGASLTVSREIYGDNVNKEMEHAYYGPEYTDDEIKTILEEFGLVEGKDYKHLTTEELVGEASRLLSKPEAIAWFQGRSEIGPRALGNRSILLNLSDVHANNTANIIKGRQPWRPSASSIIEEAARDYFAGIGISPFMVLAFPILYKKQAEVLSGTHQFGDKLARPQTVSKKSNPLYWALLNAVKQLTNIPAVVNTSLNKQEPLVENPEEALNTFFYMDNIQHLFMGNFVVHKNENLNPRIISLQDSPEFRCPAERDNINSWLELFDQLYKSYPNSHKIEVVIGPGLHGEKKISFPLVKDLFSGPLKEDLLNVIASLINSYAIELKTKRIYIGTTFEKMDMVVYQLIKDRLVNDFPKMKYFANRGNEIEILPLSNSNTAESYEKTIGPRELSMNLPTQNIMSSIHNINMSLALPSEENVITNYIIVEELLPYAVRSQFKIFLRQLYRKYPFLKEKEMIKVVPKEQLSAVIDQMISDPGRKNLITVALTDSGYLDKLPEGVKALVFSGIREEDDFIHLEGIIAALRALQQGNVPHLIEIFEFLTGNKFIYGDYSVDDILRITKTPKELVKILLFNMKPAKDLTDALALNKTMLTYIEESA